MNRFFASDNCAGVHPEIMRALANVSQDHFHSYGDDPVTEESLSTIKRLFLGTDSEEIRTEIANRGDGNPYSRRNASLSYVFNGTAANIIGIASLLRPGQSVACGQHAHINDDEGGAIEAATGIKLRHVRTAQGKVRVSDLEELVEEIGNVHKSQPALLSVSQTSELGTLYEPSELRALADWAHEHSMYFHVDGARISNAVAAQLDRLYPDWPSMSPSRLKGIAETLLRQNTVEAGVDVLSLGGTKNGLMFGEGVAFFVDPGKIGVTPSGWPSLDLYVAMGGRRAAFVRKHHMQLASKMRYISVQMQALYGSDLWFRNALHANAMAQNLAEGIRELAAELKVPAEGPAWEDGIASGPVPRLIYESPANALFVQFPPTIVAELQEKHFFYLMDEKRGIARLMCSWDTEESDIKEFLSTMRSLLSKKTRA